MVVWASESGREGGYAIRGLSLGGEGEEALASCSSIRCRMPKEWATALVSLVGASSPA